jgi:ubiquinone/menaquinone biosynthesis C-methylase UbiE
MRMKHSFSGASDYYRWNEEMSRQYDPDSYHLRSGRLIRWIERRRVQAILQLLDAGAADTVVEVGVGSGVVLAQIPAGRRIGLDLSGFLLRKYQAKMARHNLLLVQADGEMLPFAAASQTHLVCTEVIEHVPQPAQVARELARVAAGEAVIVITIPNEGLIKRAKHWIHRLGLAGRLLKGSGEAAYDSPEGDNEWHLHDFDLPLLRRVTAGVLEIVNIKAVPGRFLPLRYVVSFRSIFGQDEQDGQDEKS